MSVKSTMVLKVVGWFFFVLAGILFLLMFRTTLSRSVRLGFIFGTLFTVVLGIYLTTLSWLIRLLKCVSLRMKIDGMNWYTPEEVEAFRLWWGRVGSGLHWTSPTILVMGAIVSASLRFWSQTQAQFIVLGDLIGGLLVFFSLALFHWYWIGRKVAKLVERFEGNWYNNQQ